MIAAIWRAITTVAPPAAPADPVDIAVRRILGGETPIAVAYDLELGAERAREASRRAHALKPRATPRRGRRVVSAWPLTR